jgi:hypothetical protein
MKDTEPPPADISPGDRAFRAAKSRVEGLCWQRAKGVDAVRKQYHDALEPLMQLAEANPDRHYGAELLNTFLPMIAAYGEPDGEASDDRWRTRDVLLRSNPPLHPRIT